MSKGFHFDGLLTNGGWLSPAYVVVEEDGNISSISTEPDQKSEVNLSFERVRGFAIPGFQNAHSHAFQYAMAGLAEHLPVGSASDDFWSWREAMYRLALSISPEQMQAIATMLYAEMARHGYTSVAEFHYLHHGLDGTPYEHLAEMGERLVLAAQSAGIRITLIPIFYQMGGFEKQASPQQRRFLSKDCDTYFALLEASQKMVQRYQHAHLGVGIHSLRAVQSNDIQRTFAEAHQELPRHIHVAEQQKEVDACISVLQRRPVEWLLENVELDGRYHLVHATHLIEKEIAGIASSGAHVVLCPSTEGNLGDGFFPLREYIQRGGRWSIGTDSHIGLHPAEELRILDYGQRLLSQKRNVLCLNAGEDSGHNAYVSSLWGGRKAMGNLSENCFAVGEPLDAVVYDASHPILAITPKERRLSAMVYATGPFGMLGTLVDGKWVVSQQKHREYEVIQKRFTKALDG